MFLKLDKKYFLNFVLAIMVQNSINNYIKCVNVVFFKFKIAIFVVKLC